MKFLFIFILSVTYAFALETDNFIVWDRDLEDSREIINDYFADEIEKVLRKNDGKNKSCKEITAAIARNFKSLGVSHNPVENFLVQNLKPEYFYPHTFEYVSESIYRNPFLPHIPKFGLSPNIQVNGYYLGTDKLSHFASTGYIYYLIFSTTDSFEKAITYGVKDEQSLHGYWASGVFSYADLEANFQGLRFYINLCESYLKQDTSGAWKLLLKPDIGDYINADWDESFNSSYFVSGNWPKVAPALQEYCDLFQSDRMINRRSYYRKSQKSFSRKFLETVKLPPVQSFENLCSL